MLKLTDFYYDLPPELVARYPTEKRTQSRLLSLNRATGNISHHAFSDIIDFLKPNDLLVLNNTRVLHARLFAEKPTGGHVEILIERLLNDHEALVHMHANRSLKIGAECWLDNGMVVQVIGRENNLFHLAFLTDEPILKILEAIGHVPLPPYLNRMDEAIDRERYQTVYATHPGSVAAPTAGLHFDEALLETLQKKGVMIDFVTLHVGAGTFQPVREENILDHHMHAEYIEVSKSLCEIIKETKAKGGRVIAVGTTTVRSLETAAQKGELNPYAGETDIFIFPGFQFKVIDAMITNFHLPESTLLMLVSAFAGRDKILASYQAAIKNRYRFFSYGDAMWIG